MSITWVEGLRHPGRLRCLGMGSEIGSKMMRSSMESALFTCPTHRSSGGDYGWALETWKHG